MKVIILAGGKGTRLWPYSRAKFSKHFLRIGGELSLLERTLLLFLKINKAQDIFIITCEDQYYLVKNQAANINSKLADQIIVEPERKSTGPAIALAVKSLQAKGIDENECFVIAPSDHFIQPEEQFLNYVLQAEEITKKNEKIILLGVVPTRPETGYGYIKTTSSTQNSFIPVEKFIEKPTLEVAKEYVRNKNFFWNCGIFAFRFNLFHKELKAHAPDIFFWFENDFDTMRDNYSKMPDISFDYCLIEKSKSLGVIPMNLIWSDIGSWDSIFDVLHKDENENAILGNVIDINSKKSLIVGGKRLICTIGLEDMIVIDTEDATFLCKRGESQQVKQLVEILKHQGKKEITEHVPSLGEDDMVRVEREKIIN